MIDVPAILDLHETAVARWHEREIDNPYEGFLRLVCDQHEQNFRLWHQEDIARSTSVTDAELAGVKRAIDKLNQQRNDLIERLDDFLLAELAAAGVAGEKGTGPICRNGPEAGTDAQRWSSHKLDLSPFLPLNTETPGSAIDRLSILSLRLYHMAEQAARRDATPEHVAKANARLEILGEQRRDLSNSLIELVADIFAGRKRLKVYRQFKMYNDPTMNPYLYAAGRQRS